MTKRIMFVDDQQEPLFYHKVMLNKSGFEVIFFRSVTEAVEFVQSFTIPSDLPDLIILDINMPPDSLFADDPNNPEGRRTGILLFKELYTIIKQNGFLTPHFMVLTQIQDPIILDEAKGILPGTPVLDKFENGPGLLLQKVSAILA